MNYYGKELSLFNAPIMDKRPWTSFYISKSNIHHFQAFVLRHYCWQSDTAKVISDSFSSTAFLQVLKVHTQFWRGLVFFKDQEHKNNAGFCGCSGRVAETVPTLTRCNMQKQVKYSKSPFWADNKGCDGQNWLQRCTGMKRDPKQHKKKTKTNIFQDTYRAHMSVLTIQTSTSNTTIIRTILC